MNISAFCWITIPIFKQKFKKKNPTPSKYIIVYYIFKQKHFFYRVIKFTYIEILLREGIAVNGDSFSNLWTFSESEMLPFCFSLFRKEYICSFYLSWFLE